MLQLAHLLLGNTEFSPRLIKGYAARKLTGIVERSAAPAVSLVIGQRLTSPQAPAIKPVAR